MNIRFKKKIKWLLAIMQNLGFNPLITLELKFYRRFRKDRAEWLKTGWKDNEDTYGTFRLYG